MANTFNLSDYKMPAEWHTHSGTLLSWPQNRETWPGERLDRVERVYGDIIRVLHQSEPVHLIVADDATRRRAERVLKKQGVSLSELIWHDVEGNDVWTRDFGPIVVLKEHDAPHGTASGARNRPSGRPTPLPEDVLILDWEYNAWGGKYPPFDSDNAIPRYLADRYALPYVRPGMVLEGGSIETNGNGVLLTTESVLLHPNRNPNLTKTEIETNLKTYLGHDTVIWLKNGLAGDDTDGHIDDLSRFLNETTILTMVSNNKQDINHAALQENLNILKASADANGRPFDIITLPMPETIIEGTTVDGSEHVPASYANFYIANQVVLVPLYDARYDEEALDVFRQFFPDREIAGIPCQDLVWGQGSMHCITQQLYGM